MYILIEIVAFVSIEGEHLLEPGFNSVGRHSQPTNLQTRVYSGEEEHVMQPRLFGSQHNAHHVLKIDCYTGS